MKNYVIGVDIGGTNIRVALLNEKLEILKKETALTMDFPTADDFLKQIQKMIKTVDDKNKAKTIGMAIPAPWTKDTKVITDVTNIPCLEELEVDRVLTYFKEYKVYLENDVNVIALLESECGAAINYDNSIYITVSTGIGSGIIINNQIYHGAHGYAGEIGSVIISKSSRESWQNTLEANCSGKALDYESVRLFGENGNTKDLFLRYENKEVEAKAVIEGWIGDLTSGLASVIQVLDPGIIVFGGPIVLNHSWVIETLKTVIGQKLLGKLSEKIEMVIAEYGTDAGLIGAGYYAMMKSKGDPLMNYHKRM